MSTHTQQSAIRDARKRAKLSLAQVANRVGVTKAAVAGWESDRFLPTPAAAVALTRTLPGLTLEAIYSKAA